MSFSSGPFTLGGFLTSTPSTVATVAESSTSKDTSHDLKGTDFDRLLELLGSRLPPDDPAINYLKETPRRNLTQQVKQQVANAITKSATTPTKLTVHDELLELKKIFELILPVFMNDADALRLQLEEQVVNTSKVNDTITDGIKSTFLGLILYCLSQYPWFIKKTSKPFAAGADKKKEKEKEAANTLPPAADIGEEMIRLGKILVGIQKSVAKYGFKPNQPIIGGFTTENLNQAILPLCVMQFGRPPLSALVPPMMQLIPLLVSSQEQVSSLSISLAPTNEPRLDIQYTFQKLFQQNPNMSKELLPLVRVLRKNGAKAKELISNPNDLDDERKFNIWIYISSWMTLDKVEFLLRWLLEEPNLSEIYDPNYKLDFGDGRGPQTILAYVYRLKKGHANHTSLQIYAQIIYYLSLVTGGPASISPANWTEEEEDVALNTAIMNSLATASGPASASTIASGSSVSSSSSSSTSSRPVAKSSTLETIPVTDLASFRLWMEDQLKQFPKRCISAHILERITSPLRSSSNVTRFTANSTSKSLDLTPSQKTELHDAVSLLIQYLREQPEQVDFCEEDAYGNILFHSILSLPTNELIRLKSLAAVFFGKIDLLPPSIMSDFRRVLATQSAMAQNELYSETLLFDPKTHTVTPVAAGSSVIVGHRIFPIFHPDTIRYEVIGIQWFQPSNSPVPLLQLWDAKTQQVMAVVDTSRMIIQSDAYNVGEFDSPVILNEADHAAEGVIGTIWLHHTSQPARYCYTASGVLRPKLAPHDDYKLDDWAHYANTQIYPNQKHTDYIYHCAPVTRRVYSDGSYKPSSSSSGSIKPTDYPAELISFQSNKLISAKEEAKTNIEVGTTIQFKQDGYVYGLRVHNRGNPVSKHTLKLWHVSTKTLLASVSIRGASGEWLTGWLEQPIAVKSTNDYVVSFNTGDGGWYARSNSLVSTTPDSIQCVKAVSGPGGEFPEAALTHFGTADVLFSTTPTTRAPKVSPSIKPLTDPVTSSTTTATSSSTTTEAVSSTSATANLSDGGFSFSLDPTFSVGAKSPVTKVAEAKTDETAASTSADATTEFKFTPVEIKSPPKELSKLTSEEIFRDALPTHQIGNQGQILILKGNSASAPLDLLFSRHSPYPMGEFIYQLFDQLLHKAITVDTAHPTVQSIIDDGAVGNVSSQYGRLSNMNMEIPELKVWLELFDRHSIHGASPPATSSTETSVKPVLDDIFGTWIRNGDIGRIREWFSEQHSTDSLWPTRIGSNKNDSLLDTAKKLSLDATFTAIGQNRANIDSIVKYLQIQFDRWYDLYLPLIRVNVMEQLIPDLSEIVLEFILPPRTPPKPRTNDDDDTSGDATSSSTTSGTSSSDVAELQVGRGGQFTFADGEDEFDQDGQPYE